MSEQREKLAEVEFAHGGYKAARTGQGWLCWCDEPLSNWWPEGGVTPRDSAIDYALRAHRTEALSDALAQMLAETRAEALRGVRFRVEVACDGYEALTHTDVPDRWTLEDDSCEAYRAGARDAAREICTALGAAEPDAGER